LPSRISSPNVQHDLLPGGVGVELVDVVEVDVVGLQPAQAGLDGAPHVDAGQAALVASVTGRVGDLGGQHPALAGVFERAADHLLGLAVGVDVGRVDEVDAGLERVIDDAPRLRLIGRAAEHHGAEAELGDLHAAVTEHAVLHGGHGTLLVVLPLPTSSLGEG
jgi:hypothetical protein